MHQLNSTQLNSTQPNSTQLSLTYPNFNFNLTWAWHNFSLSLFYTLWGTYFDKMHFFSKWLLLWGCELKLLAFRIINPINWRNFFLKGPRIFNTFMVDLQHSHFIRITPLILSTPKQLLSQLQLNSTQSCVWHENQSAHHHILPTTHPPTHPQQLNVNNISAVTYPILTKL